MTPTHTRFAALVAAALLTVAACGSDDDASTDDASAESEAPGDTSETEPADTEAESTEAPSTEAPSTEAPSTETSDSTPAESEADDAEAENADTSITLVTYESFPSEGTRVNDELARFTAETGIDVEILIAGDTGTMLSKAELTAGNPEGDVMWGIDSTFISRAINSEIFEPYTADGLDAIPSDLTDLVPNGEATPVDFGDVCINYDIAALDDLGVDPPNSLEDLTLPEYQDMLVVQNPATSSPGLAFLLATVDQYGEDEWQDYWLSLLDNGVEVVDGWTAAYYEQFSYAGGDRPLVVSYGSSPPFEVLYAETELDTAPTGVVESTCYRQVEFAGILAGTDQPDAAQQLIDFLVTTEFQEALPLDVFVFPANADAALDPVFTEYAVIPESSREIDPDTVDANREAWIDEWTDLVLG
ncbi:thiamine ABC transporter substrate-binding protein [Ilumatobacter nonamiensis]|uniref:thiamine ABC transporter substrate-binding protein n=1 Tax=Ilumatobacter nonamiensis TaxID=467093 RepID=UPI00034B8074|nr:thiamine ABC transporter substrate-binding protein [Ilumatobacter nonamiensis]